MRVVSGDRRGVDHVLVGFDDYKVSYRKGINRFCEHVENCVERGRIFESVVVLHQLCPDRL